MVESKKDGDAGDAAICTRKKDISHMPRYDRRDRALIFCAQKKQCAQILP